MSQKLFISTSQGIYVYSENTDVKQVLSNKHTKGFFRKKGLGYFGICMYEKMNKIIVASREKLKTKRHNKPATDVTLHLIDPQTLQTEKLATLYDVHDVHQIACDGHYVYLTDTGKNRIVCFNLENNSVDKILNIGNVREDIHHLNAVLIENDNLMIGLNNRGKESQILTVPLSTIVDIESESDIYDESKVHTVQNVANSHDIRKCAGRLLCCSSHKGWVVDINTFEVLIQEQNWVRGLSCNDSLLYVGASHFASRNERHKNNAGLVYQYDLKTFEKLGTIQIENAGQINDLLLI